nr:hypothetical protein Itr_chr12CG17680 [Ipomoea trifida]
MLSSGRLALGLLPPVFHLPDFGGGGSTVVDDGAIRAPHCQSSEMGILGIELREHDIVLGNAGVVDKTQI